MKLSRPLAVPTYRLIQVAMLAVLTTAFVTSFSSGTDGATRLGFAAAFAAALPLVCDVIAGVATVIHARVRADSRMRRLAAWYVLVPMALSWGANSIDHMFRAAPEAVGWTAQGRGAWYVAVIVGAGVCPVAVAALLHLSTRFIESEARRVERDKRSTARRRPAVTAPIEASPPADMVMASVVAATPATGPADAPDDELAVRRAQEVRAKEALRGRRRRAAAKAKRDGNDQVRFGNG